MSVRALIGLILTAATYMELHHWCRLWWAEEIDRARGDR